MNKIELTLPEWAFLDAHSHLGDQLHGRTVILHIRSMTVIEIFDVAGKVAIKEGVLRFPFQNSETGERLMAVLHFSTTVKDKDTLICILKEGATWYCNYSHWEDQQLKLT